MLTRTENLAAPDGGTFIARLVEPEQPSGKGVVLFHEIFGLVPYIDSVAARLAELGYTVLAPDLFWRLEPGVHLDPPDENVQNAIEFASRFDWDKGVDDAGAALTHLRTLTGGRTGVLGFCFGGTLAFKTSIAHDPDFAVSYYGSGVPDDVERMPEIDCPLLLHFGGSDPFISRDAIRRIEELARGRPDVEVHLHPDATHAFDNHDSATFYSPTAAANAWRRTTDFLRRNA